VNGSRGASLLASSAGTCPLAFASLGPRGRVCARQPTQSNEDTQGTGFFCGNLRWQGGCGCGGEGRMRASAIAGEGQVEHHVEHLAAGYDKEGGNCGAGGARREPAWHKGGGGKERKKAEGVHCTCRSAAKAVFLVTASGSACNRKQRPRACRTTQGRSKHEEF